jgi:hypothetical protein
MTRATASAFATFAPAAVRVGLVLILGAVLAVVLLSVFAPALAVPPLSPTRWFTIIV